MPEVDKLAFRRGDAVPDGLCRRCGMHGPHETALACIDALRDLVAILQFRLSAERKGKNPISRA
jgi:hypothetical protein